MYIREYQDFTLQVQPGRDIEGNQLPIPSGTIPRLLLVWIVTHVQRHPQERKIALGNSLTQFMRELGLDNRHGGAKGDRHRLAAAMEALFQCRISFINKGNTADKLRFEHRQNMDVCSETYICWNSDDPARTPMWGSWICLGEKFHKAILEEAPIPCDLVAIRGLKKSPLALDLYMLCNYLGFLAAKRGRPEYTAWSVLADQIGTQTNKEDFKNLKRKVHAAMLKVKNVHPGLSYGYDTKRGGLLVYPDSKPAIEPRETVTKKPATSMTEAPATSISA